MPRGQTTWPAALCGLEGKSDTTARHSLFCWTTSSVGIQTQTFNHTIFSYVSRREAELCLVAGPLTPSLTLDQTFPPRWHVDGRRLYGVGRACLVAPVGLAG